MYDMPSWSASSCTLRPCVRLSALSTRKRAERPTAAMSFCDIGAHRRFLKSERPIRNHTRLEKNAQRRTPNAQYATIDSRTSGRSSPRLFGVGHWTLDVECHLFPNDRNFQRQFAHLPLATH